MTSGNSSAINFFSNRFVSLISVTNAAILDDFELCRSSLRPFWGAAGALSTTLFMTLSCVVSIFSNKVWRFSWQRIKVDKQVAFAQCGPTWFVEKSKTLEQREWKKAWFAILSIPSSGTGTWCCICCVITYFSKLGAFRCGASRSDKQANYRESMVSFAVCTTCSRTSADSMLWDMSARMIGYWPVSRAQPTFIRSLRIAKCVACCTHKLNAERWTLAVWQFPMKMIPLSPPSSPQIPQQSPPKFAVKIGFTSH